MRDHHQPDYRTRSLSACLSRLFARLKQRLSRFERRAGTFVVVSRDDDDFDYITPRAVPMGKRRAQ